VTAVAVYRCGRIQSCDRYRNDLQQSLSIALGRFNESKNSPTRFTELDPRLAQLARAVATQYDPTQLIVEALEHLHKNGTVDTSIAAVAEEACHINQPLAVEALFNQSRREDVLIADGHIDLYNLNDPTIYKSGIHFQFKYHLYNIGLLTTGGTDTKSGELANPWRLEHPIGGNDQVALY
jgi:hypothetical protein